MRSLHVIKSIWYVALLSNHNVLIIIFRYMMLYILRFNGIISVINFGAEHVMWDLGQAEI